MARRNWLLAVMAAMLIGGGTMRAEEERVFTRVRAADDTFRALIRDGDARSAAFRAMVDEIQASNAIVMVQFGLCAKGQVRSCVSHVGGDARTRTIRILVDTRTTGDRLIATIAHELQHALEIIREPGVTNSDEALRLYRKIATGKCGEGRSDRCETEAALAVEARVLSELEAPF
jgi:hypothetical protein